MRWNEIIGEMPVRNQHHLSKPADDKGKTKRNAPLDSGPEAFVKSAKSSFRKPADKKLASNVKRTEKAFAKNEHDFDFYFVNSPEANKHTEVGLVDAQWVSKNMPEFNEQFQKLYNPEHITVIFTNNKGANWVPMTPWIMAHRIGHASARTSGFGRNQQYEDFKKEMGYWTRDILQNVYGLKRINTLGQSSREEQLILKKFWEMIGDFSSARRGKLRDYFEMWNELIAQYLIKGELNFRPLQPRFGGKTSIISSELDADDLEMMSDYYLPSMAENVQARIANIFWGLEGKVLVM